MDASWSHLKFLDPATRLLTETFMRSLNGFSNITLFRKIARIGLKHSPKELQDEFAQLMHELETNPDYAGFTKPLDPNKPRKPGWSSRVVARDGGATVRGQQESFTVATDAASLVFAHSILDDAAFQYCRVTAIVSPSSWEPFVSKKKMSLEEVRGKDYQSMLNQNIEAYLKQLERESMMKKIDKLFEICKPKPKPESQQNRGFSYDRNRLKSLDLLRHDIVHGSGPVKSLPRGDEDLYFMHQCAAYLMSVVNMSFGVKLSVPD